MNNISEAVKDIESKYKHLGDERKKNHACYRHDIFAERKWNDLEQPVYAWQWNFSQDEYDGIKTLLTEYSNEIPEIIQQSSICCKLIQLYISEWYKREYNGNDSNNAFKSICVKKYSTLAEKICLKLGIDDKKVYKSRNVNGQEEGQNEWLYTIYVDGGLPLTYLSDKSKANDFKNTIYEIICEKDKENALEFIGDDLGDLCRNGVINQSYQARNLYPEDRDASIYDFIQEFILTENLKIDGFDNFHDIIQDDKKKKFEVRVLAFKIGNSFILSPQLYLRPEPNGSNYAISQARLNAWGINPQSNPFELHIECGDKTLWEEYYEKCLDGSYITRSRRITYDIPKVKETLSLLAMPWKLIYKQGNNSVEIKGAVENKMAEQGYLQMYNGDFYTWSSKSSNTYNRSAILYYKDVVNLNDNQHTEEPISDGSYGWVEFDESIQLEIGSKIITKYCKAGQLIVDFGQRPNKNKKEKEKHPLSKYHNGQDVNNKRLAMIYVGLELEFDVQISKDSFGEIISKSIPSKDIVFEYCKGANGGFQPLNATSINTVGYYELRLTYSKTKKQVIIPCFALDGNARVHNDLGNSPRTDFQNFGAYNISRVSYVGNNVKVTSLQNNNGTYRQHWTGLLDYHNPIAIYRIVYKDAAFELRIPQPIDAIIACDKSTENIFYVGDGVGKNGTAKHLPILLADRFNFYQLPDKLLYTGYDPVEGWKQAFKAFLDYDFKDKSYFTISGKFYFCLRTFTHNYCYDDVHLRNFQQLSFIFVPIASPMGRRPICLDSAGVFDFSSIGNTEGIIVQKIDYHNPPQSIITPMYVPRIRNSQGMNQKAREKARNTRIGRYHQSYTQSLGLSIALKDAIDYFKIAIETGMYFGSFDALLGIVVNCVCKNYEYSLIPSPSVPKILAKFYHQYYDDCINNGIRVNYDALWRLADEFLFDWTLIPRSDWENEFSKNWAEVTQLFGYRYSKSGTDSLAQWLHGGYTTYKLTKSIPKENNEWNIYVRTITGQYGSGRNSQSQADFWSLDFDGRVPVMKLLHNKEKHNEITKII